MWDYQIYCKTPEQRKLVCDFLESKGYHFSEKAITVKYPVIVIDLHTKSVGSDFESKQIWGKCIDFNFLFSEDFGKPKSIDVALNNKYKAIVEKEEITITVNNGEIVTHLPITVIDALVKARDQILKN